MMDMVQNAGVLFVGFFALLMLGMGVLLMNLGFFALQRSRAAVDWPQVPGVVDVSDVLKKQVFEDNEMYQPRVHCRYSAPGGVYVCTKLAHTEKLYASQLQAQKVADQYRVGATVVVRYNPDDPSEAVLHSAGSGGFWLLGFGVLCWIVPAAASHAAGFSWPVIALVALGLVAVLTALFVGSGSGLAKLRSQGLLPPADQCTDADVKALRDRGEKLSAIRLYREVHGAGLKDAREAVERL